MSIYVHILFYQKCAEIAECSYNDPVGRTENTLFYGKFCQWPQSLRLKRGGAVNHPGREREGKGRGATFGGEGGNIAAALCRRGLRIDPHLRREGGVERSSLVGERTGGCQ